MVTDAPVSGVTVGPRWRRAGSRPARSGDILETRPGRMAS